MEPPAPGKVVVAHADRAARRALERLVGAALCPVEAVGDVAALRAAVDPDTIAIVDLAIAQAEPELRDHPARAWIAVPGVGAAPAAAGVVGEMLARRWWHVVSHPMPVLAEELLTSIQKLRRGEVFGLDKYIAWSAEIRSYTLDDTRARDAVLAAIAADAAAIGLPDRLGTQAVLVAGELITNALYLAPLDERNQRYRAGEAPGPDRPHRGRPLRGRDVVTVRWASDARYLALEVRDRWGTLDPDAVTERLVSGKLAAAEGERGLGLALAYACCNQFVIDVEPGVMTEVIAVLDVRDPAIELGRSASFHTFAVATPREE